MITLIATAGRPDSLRDTLLSIAQASKQTISEGVIVVENGSQCGSEAICRDVSADTSLKVRYQFTPVVGKSRALNTALRTIDDDALVFMTDDDVLLDPGLLQAYSATIQPRDHRLFYGGPFDVHRETEPPEWLVRYLPPSAKGFYPDPNTFDPAVGRFMGCNWAAYAGDLKAAGGFDPRLGPGAPTGATGQETNMQIRLHAAGWRSQLVPEAIVSHFVPAERCTPQWVLDRARRFGISRGVTSEQKPLGERVADQTVKRLQLVARTIQLPFLPPEKRFRSEWKRNRQQGFLRGLRYRNAA